MLNEALRGVLFEGLRETVYMTVVATLGAYIIGLPLGILLNVTSKGGIKQNRAAYFIIGAIVNILRSVPFLILLIVVKPFTRLVVGTSIGAKAAIVPLVIAAAPYVARLVESSLKEVDVGVVEAARSMGANTFQLIFKVLIPEARSSLVVGFAIAVTTILGYSALAGCIGSGGLGDIAFQYGYVRRIDEMLYISVIILVVLVQIMQEAGLVIAKRIDKRNKT